jgi:hypothetical protein
MKKNSTLWLASLLIISSLSINACGGKQGDSHEGHGDASPSTENTATADNKTEAKSEKAVLRLDNGKKWDANPATHEGMTKMKALIEKSVGGQTVDYKALGTSLQAESAAIIKQCDMKGEAHDQLHIVLVPMLGFIAKLQDGSGGQAEVDAMNAELGRYFAYFE